MKIQDYIHQNWDKTIKYQPKDKGTVIGLPYPYTSPCMTEQFTTLFYWDTYFTNKGLLESGRIDLAKNNVKNFIFLINNFGLIPNNADRRILTRSQPPFFGLMLKDVLEAEQDEDLKRVGYHALVKEMEFWETKRKSTNGLNNYSSDIPSDDIELQKETVEFYNERTGGQKPLNFHSTLNVLAECESGWDYTHRFYGKCNEYNPVCLNSILWFSETYLAKLEQELGISDGKKWQEKAEKRKEVMLALLRADDGLFYDYSYVDNQKSDILSCASFYPYFVGMCKMNATEKDRLLNAFELRYGLQSTSDNYGQGNYQWGKGTVWAPLQFIAVQALKNSGFEEDGQRIADKYIALIEKSFEKTGKLWEKYDGVIAQPAEVSEETVEMLGWTAGVYLSLRGSKTTEAI